MLSVQLNKQRDDFKLNLQFDCAAGDVIALFGASGCGKTTTAHLIAGLLAPDTGRIQLGERVLFDSSTHINLRSEQRRIGYVFQESRLFPHLTVDTNLRYGMNRSAEKHIEFDDVVQLLGIEALLSRRPRQLSGGEKQRVAIGRALLSQPQLLLLDEPLASLDAARRDEVLPYLERLRDFLRIPMLYVSHQFEETLRLASHVVLMERGSCLAQGTVADMSRHPALRKMVGNEMIGSVIEGHVAAIDADSGLASIGLKGLDSGADALRVEAQGLQLGHRIRLHVLARDVIVARARPDQLSVRNALPATLISMAADVPHAVMLELELSGSIILSRITAAAARELDLQPGQTVWALIKTVMLRGHVWERND